MEDRNPKSESFFPAANLTRRDVLKRAGQGTLVSAAVASGVVAAEKAPELNDGRMTLKDAAGEFFQKHYKAMSQEEIQAAIERLQRKYKARYDVDASIDNTPPLEGVVFGYALNISKCKGYRECVRGCVEENNQSRDPEIQYIRVLEFSRGSMNFEEANRYYDHDKVPQEDKFYLPVQCMQCDNSPCERACPVGATWKEKDGIVVIDYNWCIGCRYCMAACPYDARRFNWADPNIPKEQINPNMHYLSNRPRMRGVVEKCTWCLQRTRKGRMPACQEACPTGARVFGNLLDPNSEIRYVLEHKTVFRLREELNTEPKFWYYTD